MKILITAPSLDEKQNVSGISTLIREITGRSRAEFVHFQAGRKDGEGLTLIWLFNQALLPFRFFNSLRAEKPDVVHINTAFIKLAILRDVALVFAARIAKRPVVLHIHGGPFVMKEFDSRLLKAITKQMVRWSNRLVVFSELEKTNLAARFPGANIGVLPNAISLDNIVLREPTSDVRTMIFLARHHHSKGLIYVVDACRDLAAEGVPMKFACYGTGPEREWFVTRMTETLGEKFFYGGVVAGREKWKALSQADIFFLPSRDEGLPFALLEAMAAGCVPVMADSGAVSTVIENGRNGFIIEAGNLEQTTGKLRELLAPETDLKTLRENALRTVAERFNIEGYISRLEMLYEDVIKQNVGK